MNYIRSKKINIGKLAHDVIMKQPSIQPQEPNTGRWEYIQYYKPSMGNWHCSECGRIVFLLKSQKFDETPLYDYCPWCGAKMESEE